MWKKSIQQSEEQPPCFHKQQHYVINISNYMCTQVPGMFRCAPYTGSGCATLNPHGRSLQNIISTVMYVLQSIAQSCTLLYTLCILHGNVPAALHTHAPFNLSTTADQGIHRATSEAEIQYRQAWCTAHVTSQLGHIVKQQLTTTRLRIVGCGNQTTTRCGGNQNLVQ